MSDEPNVVGTSRYTIPTLVEVEGLTINLCYLILKEEKGPGPRGAIDLTLETGRMLHLQGDDADRVRRKLSELVPPAASVGAVVHGKAIKRAVGKGSPERH